MRAVRRIVLSHPAGVHRFQVYPDLGLGYIASSAKEAGFDVRLVLDALNREGIVRLMREYGPDVWGIKLFAATTTLVKRTISIIKEENPNVIVIIGGPQVNGMPKRILDFVPADYAMQGNSCERSFCQFLRSLNNGSGFETVPGLIFREGKRIRLNKADHIGNLDVLPFPPWEEMNIYKYSAGQNQVTRYFPSVPMVMSRGCNAKCRFCNLNMFGRVQRRSAENVIKEMKLLKSMYDIQEVLFQDSNFAYDRKETLHFCQLLIDERLELKWTLPQGTRLSTLDDEVLSMLSRAGCYRISVGIETGDGEVQRLIRKGVNLDKIDKRLRAIRKHDIEILANFMIGFPGETKKQIKRTLEVALKLPLDYANFYIFTPYPGSSFFKELVAKGKITEEAFQEWNKFTYKNCLSEMTAEELERFRTKMVWKFYLRPHQILQILSNFHHFTYVKVLLRVLFSHYISTNSVQRLYFKK